MPIGPVTPPQPLSVLSHHRINLYFRCTRGSEHPVRVVTSRRQAGRSPSLGQERTGQCRALGQVRLLHCCRCGRPRGLRKRPLVKTSSRDTNKKALALGNLLLKYGLLSFTFVIDFRKTAWFYFEDKEARKRNKCDKFSKPEKKTLKNNKKLLVTRLVLWPATHTNQSTVS